MGMSLEVMKLRLNSSDWQTMKLSDPDISTHLASISRGPDRLLAARAINLAGITASAASQAIVVDAAKSRIASLRIAAAHAAKNLSTINAVLVLSPLLKSKDAGIRKCALESAKCHDDPNLRATIENMCRNDSNMMLRQLAQLALQESSPTTTVE